MIPMQSDPYACTYCGALTGKPGKDWRCACGNPRAVYVGERKQDWYQEKARRAWHEEWSVRPQDATYAPNGTGGVLRVGDVLVRLLTDDLVRMGLWPPMGRGAGNAEENPRGPAPR